MEPVTEPLDLPAAYGRPDRTLAWPDVRRMVERATHYWISTTRADDAGTSAAQRVDRWRGFAPGTRRQPSSAPPSTSSSTNVATVSISSRVMRSSTWPRCSACAA